MSKVLCQSRLLELARFFARAGYLNEQGSSPEQTTFSLRSFVFPFWDIVCARAHVPCHVCVCVCARAYARMCGCDYFP